MRRTLLFILERRRVVSLFVAVFLSVSMMLMGESAKSRFARSVTTAVFNTGRFSFSWGIYMLDLWHENKRLRLQNLELSDQINFSSNVVQENERLRKLLGFRQRFSLKDSVIVANVAGHDIDRIGNSFIIDTGLRHGVRKNMAVVTSEGLIGRIFESYHSASSVQIIKDINSKVSAVIENSNIYGFVSWRGGGNLLLYGIPRQKIPESGERVYTTGFGVYPAGLFIGTIAGEPLNEVELYASVQVKPAVNFARVKEVFVIRGSERSDIWDDGDGSGHFQRPEIQ